MDIQVDLDYAIKQLQGINVIKLQAMLSATTRDAADRIQRALDALDRIKHETEGGIFIDPSQHPIP